jgi:hypothetical protein
MATLDRERVLDELEVLATVEHALIVEYLSVCCALGHDLPADEGGPTTQQGTDAVNAAASLAQSEMIHFRDISRALVASKRSARLDRAERITTASGQVLQVPPDETSLQHLLEREETLAKAVDDKYAQLAPAVTSDPVFEGDLLDEWRRVIVENGPSHVDALADLRTALHGLAPAQFLKATRRETDDAFEQHLLAANDRIYGLVVRAVGRRFDPDSTVSGAFQDMAQSAMMALDDMNRLLVRKHLLPPFTPA